MRRMVASLKAPRGKAWGPRETTWANRQARRRVATEHGRPRVWATRKRWESSSSGERYRTMTWGDGTESQLGHYPYDRTGVLNTYQELLPRVLEVDGVEAEFVKVSCGLNHTLAVDAEGGVWSWGKSDYGKCGHGDDKDQPFPRKIDALEGVVAESVACGEHHSAVVDTEGRVYTWGWGGSWLEGGGHLGHGSRADTLWPTVVSYLDDGGYRVASVSCGLAHTLILTDDGEALTCGAGEHGRNGNGRSGDVLVPEPVPALEDVDVAALEAGSAFSLALTAENDVLVWGRNDQGQLGLGGGLAMDVYAMEDLPIKVEVRPARALALSTDPHLAARAVDGVDEGLADNDEAAVPLKAKCVAAGHSHAAVVSTDGVLYYWGMKAHLEPVAPVFPDGHKPLRIFAGGNYTHVLCTDGTLHSFGEGRQACLGHGDKKGLAHPKQIQALDDYAGRVADVAAGFRHVAVLCSA